MAQPETQRIPASGFLPEEVVFGISPAMQFVRHRVEKVGRANVPVLIQGESGTGKEVIARMIHRYSSWLAGPFVEVSCPAIPATLLESELFGYEKGAFTGANASKPGRVEQANEGTLFLDGIAELDLALQAKLLQLLQDGQFSRIGGQQDTRVDVRVICATTRRLEEEIAAGRFREDLYYRINVVKIDLPPLRERSADIGILMDYFLNAFQTKYGREANPLSAHVRRRLQEYHWPGNIRELENLIKRYVILGTEDVIENELPHPGNGMKANAALGEGPISLKNMTRQATQELERKVILTALESNNWNRKRAARALNISYRALLYKIRQAGLGSRRTRILPPAAAAGAAPAAD